ncbi:MAG: metallophosphoesterase family protein [Candidatus Promineifilaceae bacterium]
MSHLYAISDLHVGHPKNRAAIAKLPEYPDDWLIIAGDIGEKVEHFHYTFGLLTRRFAKLFWVPGNHDLWTLPKADMQLRGVARYQYLVELCRDYGVVTPEDPFVEWTGAHPALIVPIFVGYDYTFRPAGLSKEIAMERAKANNIYCVDEIVLHPDPHASRQDWCAARLRYTEQRLNAVTSDKPWIVVNHYPLRQDLAKLPRIPQFTLWCGTTGTEPWLQKFPIDTAVYGHLHIRQNARHDGVRHEEVSLGYPRQWNQARDLASYLRKLR